MSRKKTAPPGPLVNVAVLAALREPLTYRVPPSLDVRLGQRVLVPLATRRAIGVVIEPVAQVAPGVNVREVLRVLDVEPVLSPELVTLGLWIAEYYLAPVGEVFLRHAAPARRDSAAEAAGADGERPRAAARAAIEPAARDPRQRRSAVPCASRRRCRGASRRDARQSAPQISEDGGGAHSAELRGGLRGRVGSRAGSRPAGNLERAPGRARPAGAAGTALSRGATNSRCAGARGCRGRSSRTAQVFTGEPGTSPQAQARRSHRTGRGVPRLAGAARR